MSEKISAFIDSQLEDGDREKVIDELLEEDGESRATWRRFSQINAALSGNPVILDAGFASRVANSLVEEPTVVAPGALQAVGSVRKRWSVQIIAVAASLAIVSIIVINQLGEETAPPRLATQEAAGSKPAAEGRNLPMNRLNRYLVEHGEFTTASGLNGLMAYAKFVSNDEDR